LKEDIHTDLKSKLMKTGVSSLVLIIATATPLSASGFAQVCRVSS